MNSIRQKVHFLSVSESLCFWRPQTFDLMTSQKNCFLAVTVNSSCLLCRWKLCQTTTTKKKVFYCSKLEKDHYQWFGISCASWRPTSGAFCASSPATKYSWCRRSSSWSLGGQQVSAFFHMVTTARSCQKHSCFCQELSSWWCFCLLIAVATPVCCCHLSTTDFWRWGILREEIRIVGECLFSFCSKRQASFGSCFFDFTFSSTELRNSALELFSCANNRSAASPGKTVWSGHLQGTWLLELFRCSFFQVESLPFCENR